jgi:protoporphyrinogen oxidase
MSPENVLEKTVRDLTSIGVVAGDDNIILAACQDIKYANVLYHRRHAAGRQTVLNWLEKHRIYCIGRYGEWAYLWSDQSILSGKRLAGRLEKMS